MTTPDEMKAREIANALRVNASTTGADAEEELIAAITQALSEKTEEIERLTATADEACGALPKLIERALAAEARLSEVVGENERLTSLLADMQREITGMAETNARLVDVASGFKSLATIQNGGKDNG